MLYQKYQRLYHQRHRGVVHLRLDCWPVAAVWLTQNQKDAVLLQRLFWDDKIRWFWFFFVYSRHNVLFFVFIHGFLHSFIFLFIFCFWIHFEMILRTAGLNEYRTKMHLMKQLLLVKSVTQGIRIIIMKVTVMELQSSVILLMMT